MRSTNDAAPRRRPTVAAILALTAAAIASALVPMLAGLAFLVSLAARRPLIAVAAERWPWLSGGRTGAWPAHGPRALSRLTAVWGIALLAAALSRDLAHSPAAPAALDTARQPFRSGTWIAALSVIAGQDGWDFARTRRLGPARFERAVRREITRRGGHRPCLRIVRGLFTALSDPAGVIAHRPGALERVQLLLEDW
jgi:Transposase IS116/IS110/IS902 family